MNTGPATILIVDDQPENLSVLTGLLQPHYRLRAARSGEQALRAARLEPIPDLALLDVMMPEMDGFTLLNRMRGDPVLAAIPAIFVTALGEHDAEQHGLEIGAVDYITKPIVPATVLARVRTHLELKEARDRLRAQNAELETEVARRTEALDRTLKELETAHAKLKKTYFATLTTINDLAGLRSDLVASHSRRVAGLARQVAFALGMARADAEEVFIAALLHDVGKVGFPDGLLAKSVAAMNRDELAQFHTHPVSGAQL